MGSRSSRAMQRRSAVGVAAPGFALQVGVVLAQGMAQRIEPGIGVPRFERVRHVGQTGSGELGKVSEDDALEAAVVDPLQSLVAVDLGSVVVGVETIGLEPATRVQDED